MSEYDRFANHIATYHQTRELGVPVERLVFRVPNNSTDYIEFLVVGGSLIVRGDLYDAMYEVNHPHPMRWWGNTDSGYMAQKLRGLNGHPEEHEVWESDKAREDLKILKAELDQRVREEQKDGFEAAVEMDPTKTWEQYLEEVLAQGEKKLHWATLELYHWNDYEPERYVEDRHEWEHFLRENGDDVFGDAWWESGAVRVGRMQNPMIGIHKQALDLALAQVIKNGVTLYDGE